MYPHYIMEKFLEEKTGTLNNVMIIFKNYMQEVCSRLYSIFFLPNGVAIPARPL